MFIQSLKHSQNWDLGQEAWLGSLEARHTTPFLMAVPGSNIVTYCKRIILWYFRNHKFDCLDTKYIPKVQKGGTHINKCTTSTRGIESASGERFTNYICLRKCNTRRRKVWTNGGNLKTFVQKKKYIFHIWTIKFKVMKISQSCAFRSIGIVAPRNRHQERRCMSGLLGPQPSSCPSSRSVNASINLNKRQEDVLGLVYCNYWGTQIFGTVSLGQWNKGKEIV